jgi:hypothetical protein
LHAGNHRLFLVSRQLFPSHGRWGRTPRPPCVALGPVSHREAAKAERNNSAPATRATPRADHAAKAPPCGRNYGARRRSSAGRARCRALRRHDRRQNDP